MTLCRPRSSTPVASDSEYLNRVLASGDLRHERGSFALFEGHTNFQKGLYNDFQSLRKSTGKMPSSASHFSGFSSVHRTSPNISLFDEPFRKIFEKTRSKKNTGTVFLLTLTRGQLRTRYIKSKNEKLILFKFNDRTKYNVTTNYVLINIRMLLDMRTSKDISR